MYNYSGMEGASMSKAPNAPNMNPLRWEFLDEPLWRWFTFFLAMNLLLVAWNGVIRLMRGD